MLVHSWNIQAGGGTRISAVTRCIEQHAADTIVLGETTRQRFDELCAGVRALGYVHLHGTPPAGSERGVLVASKQQMEQTDRRPVAVPAHRWIDVYFPVQRFHLIGIYAPDTRAGLDEFWPAIHEAASSWQREPVLLTGDLNAGHSVFDTEGGDLHADRWFTAMPLMGMVDLWRAKHGAARQFTWYSKHHGIQRGFRLDHAFGTMPMKRRIISVWYSHEERERRISDHSSLLIAVR